MNLIAAPVCTSTFLVGDAQCDQIQHLLRGSKTPVLALGSQTSALAAISAGLLQQREAGHPVGTLHLIAHGRPGTFRIGDQWIDAEALKAHASNLARWDVETIALWSCHLGADADFVALLEELTGAQVVASAGWLGRDDEGVEQLQMGEWNLADLLAPETWPASFRLAVNINAADGTGICAEDELLFQAIGKANGYVAVDLTLGDSNLPAGSQVWFSSSGEEGSWETEPNYTSGDLTQLSELGQGYFKVKLPDDTAKGSQINAAIKQFDIQLDLDNPVIDIQYNVLHFDEAVQLEDLPSIATPWTDIDKGTQIEKAYTYKNLLPEMNELGFKLEADVSLGFNTFLKKFTLDTDQKLEHAEDFDFKNRFQPRFGDGSDEEQSAQDVNLKFEFYLRDETGKRQKVALKNFWVDVVDLDTPHKNPNHEFFSIPSLGLASNEDGSASAAVIYTLPEGAGNWGEFGDPKLKPGEPGNAYGLENLIEVEINEEQGSTKFLGSPEWNIFHGNEDWNQYKFSNHPAGSVLLDYREPVQSLNFNAGTTGKMHAGGGDGEGEVGGSRNLSFSIGNSLTLGDGFKPSGEIQQDSASIVLEDCFDFFITPTAACENEDTELLTDASFAFSVTGGEEGSPGSLRGAYTYELTANGERVGSSYAGYSYRIEDANGNDLTKDVVLVAPSIDGGGSGTLTVNDEIEVFRVVFDVTSLSPGDQLVGDESISLKLTHGDTGAQDEKAASLDELGCDPVESNPAFTITATAACENEDTDLLTDASFTFSVKGALDPGSREPDSLRGFYDYVLLVDGERVGSEYAGYSYRIEDVNGKRLEGKKVDVNEGEVGDGVGTLEVKSDLSQFRIVFDVETLAEGEQLSGDEEVTLSLARKDTYVNDYAYATSSLADDDLGCDPLPNDRGIELEAFAACVKDGVLSNSTAEFIFNGEFKPASTASRSVDYVIDTSSGLLDGDYAFNLQFSEGVSLKEGGEHGVLAFDEGVGEFSIEITAAAADSLTGDESITLTLIDDGEVVTETSSLEKLDCAPVPPDELGKTDVALYLMMDNSTSMLQSDPSTALSGQANRLESQDRVSLYAYQQALEKAGYGFTRMGESAVLSTAEFKDAVINNSAADLAKVLNDFEVIVDPNHSGDVRDLTLYLISYGYAVDYGSVTITADDPSAGKRAAEAIIGLQTPDQIYGNSIDGNTLWAERGLPALTANDTFWGKGRPASNLYSGTEMLGALEGLEHLLAAQLNRSDADPITTYINMTTDGRPERRAWWDTRTGAGSDSLTGQPVHLPGSLGGDSITSSGLLYDIDGDATFLNNNAGEQQWTAMQNRLNATLDAIAAQQADPANRLQVSVLGMGDGSDADFPAIYSDLFGLRTFNNSGGGWSYDYFTSYALPDFTG